MSNNQKTQKTLEVKIRPLPSSAERSDHVGIARVLLAAAALSELNLKPGQLCQMWKEGEEEQKMEAVAWNTADRTLAKKSVTMSQTLRDILHFKLDEPVVIAGAGSVKIAESIVLREKSAQGYPELNQGDEKLHWDWLIRKHLCR